MSFSERFYWDKNIFNDEVEKLTKEVWPNYLIEESDLDICDDKKTGKGQYNDFLLVGLRSRDDQRLIAFFSGVTIFIDVHSQRLPDEGWRFACQAFENNAHPNSLCLLSANIHPDFQGQGIAEFLIEFAKEEAKERKLTFLLAPVRPTNTYKFPNISFDEYCALKDGNGRIFDPWLRLHKNLGAEILNICKTSILVSASIRRWNEWLGHSISTGEIPHKGIVPLQIDLEKKVAMYIEPNIWVRYSLKK
ncbi:MAG: hypothetical protein A2202_02495 [Bdellovibrionales bacterium RIFOXYA1_FULL_36_14]|nr:MAG: hypothetical protein A2202_02495 [Bdellovibrionales bacterium RIFOXYA1_FULL_36_14]